MAIATHIIKIKGKVEEGKKREEELKSYVLGKINSEIDSMFHPDLELFSVGEDGTTDVWVYVSNSYVTDDIVDKWLKDHITEDGIEIKGFEIEKLPNEGFFVMTS